MVEKRDSQKSGKDQNRVPTKFNRRTENRTAREKEREAKLEEIVEKFLKADKTGIELDIERGRLLNEARALLKQHQEWVKWHTERLGLDAMAVNKLIRRADAAETYGIKNLIKLGKAVLDILIAPEAPVEAIVEGLKRSETEKLTCAEARLIVRGFKDAQGRRQIRGRPPKEPPPEITIKNTPAALARHLATFPPVKISEIAEKALAKALKDNPFRQNASFALDAVHWVKPALPDKKAVALGIAFSRYHVRNGSITAASGGLIATTAFPRDGNFRVDAKSFERELSYAAVVPEITVDADHITIVHSDGSTASLTNLPKADAEEDRQPNGERHQLPGQLWAVLADLRKLTTDIASDTLVPGVWLKDGAAVATSGRTVGWVRDVGVKIDLLILNNVVDFILSKTLKPINLLVEPDWNWFVWPDGSALGSRQFKSDEATNKVAELFKLLDEWSEPKWAIEEEWRSAFRRVSSIGAENMHLYADHMSAVVDHSFGKKGTDTYEVSVPIKTPLPDCLNGNYLEFPVEVIKPIVDVAKAINFPAYPEKISFKGKEVMGFVNLKSPSPSDSSD